MVCVCVCVCMRAGVPRGKEASDALLGSVGCPAPALPCRPGLGLLGQLESEWVGWLRSLDDDWLDEVVFCFDKGPNRTETRHDLEKWPASKGGGQVRIQVAKQQASRAAVRTWLQ